MSESVHFQTKGLLALLQENIDVMEKSISRQDRDELALVLYDRMRSRRPVWVDSPMGQMTWINMIGLDDDGELVAYDKDGNDRRCEDYLLSSPGRQES